MLDLAGGTLNLCPGDFPQGSQGNEGEEDYESRAGNEVDPKWESSQEL